MDKKTFSIVVALLAITFAGATTLKLYRPQSSGNVSFDDFPLELGDWKGMREPIDRWTMELLNPKDIFSATYTNPEGIRVHLFFDFFSSEAAFGGPHSPRNCLPGSGWVINGTEDIPIDIGDRTIKARRFELRREGSVQIMDFWYVTRHGETANDYVFKWYETLSSLTLKPRDVAFIRIVTAGDEKSLAVLPEFEKLFVTKVYSYIPF